MVNKNRVAILLVIVIGMLLGGCASQQTPLDDMFPARVGDYLRVDGPTHDASQDLQRATYKGLDGAVELRAKFVGKDQVARALTGLPLAATNVTADPALGQRKGTFFDFEGQFHAAWGNGDWVFIISAPTSAARVAFLAGYGF